jgi:hypothetical protein
MRLLLLATFIAPLAIADLADSTTYTIQFIGGPANGIFPTAGGERRGQSGQEGRQPFSIARGLSLSRCLALAF